MNSEDTRNLFLAIALSVLVMAAWQYFYAGPLYQREHQAHCRRRPRPKGRGPRRARRAGGARRRRSARRGAPAPRRRKRSARRSRPSPRVAIDTPSLGGSIDLKGGELDDLVLKDYHETIDPKSPNDRPVLAARRARRLLGRDRLRRRRAASRRPTARPSGRADGKTLTPDQPVTLTWDNGAGLVFTRAIAVDDKYMFTITDSVVNNGGAPVSLRPYALILRRGTPKVAGYSVLHEGFVGVIGDGSVQEVTYSGIEKETGKRRATSRATAAGSASPTNIGPRRSFPSRPSRSTRASRRAAPRRRRTTRPTSSGRSKSVAPGRPAEATTRIFAGAKEVCDDRRLRDQARHQEVRSDDRLGLVLFHHQADVPADRLRSTDTSAISASRS